MPRHADTDARRTTLSEAALAIAAERGLGSVTIAGVAERAGVSVGLVQHYFPAKQQLLVAAHQRSLDLASARVAALVERGERAGRPIRGLLADALAELLRLDDRRRAECAVRAEFLGRAVGDPDLARAAAAGLDDLQARIRQAVLNGLECGETDPDLDPHVEAWQLCALTDGLARELLTVPTTPDAAGSGIPVEQILDTALGRVFPHPCGLAAAR